MGPYDTNIYDTIGTMTCSACGLENPPGAQWCDCGFDFTTGKIVPSRKLDQSNAGAPGWLLIAGGYLSGVLALLGPWILILPALSVLPRNSSFLPFLLPAGFGLIGLICGCVNFASGRREHGGMQVAIALIGGFAGTVLGFQMGIGLDH